jgi:hypothetical protein
MDRPFKLKEEGGYGSLFCSEFFFRTTRVRIFFIFLLRKAQICFHNLTLDYMTKTLNHIIFLFQNGQQTWPPGHFFFLIG